MKFASHILVPVDLSPFSAHALVYAAELARMTGATTTALTVVQDVYPFFDVFPVEYANAGFFTQMSATAEAALRELVAKEAPGFEVELRVRRGNPSAEIVACAQEESCDLIVMATHGHSGLEHALLGSVTEKVLRKAPCPVLVVR